MPLLIGGIGGAVGYIARDQGFGIARPLGEAQPEEGGYPASNGESPQTERQLLQEYDYSPSEFADEPVY